MQTSQCLSNMSLQKRGEDEDKEEDEEKKVDDDDETDMEGKRRDKEDMQDFLVVEEGTIVIFTLVPFATCLLPMQLILIQGPFQQEEGKQPHLRDTKNTQHHELCGAS